MLKFTKSTYHFSIIELLKNIIVKVCRNSVCMYVCMYIHTYTVSRFNYLLHGAMKLPYFIYYWDSDMFLK